MASKSYLALALSVATATRFAGVNIAGLDFGCGTDGTCNVIQACPPLTQLEWDGLGQMPHFVENDSYMFRLPMTGVLNQTQFYNYNMLVNACSSTGAYCEIDIHNYARYDGEIIGQGGPSNEVFAELWYNIVDYWKYENRVIFGVMNEPHGVPAGSVQAAVTATRSTGANSQIILLPGNNYTSAETFISSGSAAALNMVRNPDGSITNLVMDVHKYLDYNNSWGDVDLYVSYLSQQIAYQAANFDVILGYIGWAAGSFATNYILSETPYYNGTGWNDTLTVSTALSPVTNMLFSSVA
ncbi:glycoside hydrolase superfamily [Boletus edulis BED1]|uniref:cellulase n=1 Tax=Boletus edulis BED1 TaxID=1328754 RepID=A0AAD4BN71_BOLED|nr:glycoside hydrolase superfamily [Boletus edulis BED1]